MIYVALLRGVNVGGKGKVEMAKLKTTFEKLGFTRVKTFINSGNIVFEAASNDTPELTKSIEAAIQRAFALPVPVLLRNLEQVHTLVEQVPDTWVTDGNMRCEIIFLWPEADKATAGDDLGSNADIEDLKYVPGSLVWRVDRVHVTRSRLPRRLIGGPLYAFMTMRNINTVRKLHQLMLDAAQH